MMATFLSVLKIIGIVLLIILAVLLVILLVVLFVPVFYRLDATVPEMDLDEGFDKDKVKVSAKFSWLWFVLRGGIEYPEAMAFTLRVLGIKILPKKEKKKKDKDKEENTEDKPQEKPEEAKDETSEKPEESAGEESAGSEAEQTVESMDTDTSDAGSTEDDTDSESPQDESAADAKEEEEEPKSFLDVLWKIFDTIDNILKTPLNVFEKLQCTISRVCDKIDLIKSTLENDIFKRAFALVKKELIRVLKMILPDKCDVKVLFGSGDPANTAEIMAAYGALYPVLYKKVEFTPDFERKVVKATVHIKGHITLFTIVYAAAVCFFNKDVKKTINRIKKIINT